MLSTVPLFQALKVKLFKSPLVASLLSDAAWNLGTTILNRIVPLLISVLVAQILGKELFGEYSMLRGTISAIAVFANFGLAITTTKEIAANNDDEVKLLRTVSTAMYSSLILAVLGSGFIIVSAPFISNHFLGGGKFVADLRLLSLMLILMVLSGVLQGISNGLREYKASFIANALTLIISLPASFYLIYSYGYSGAVWAMISHAFCMFVALFYIVYSKVFREIGWVVQTSSRRLLDYLKLASPILLVQIIPTPMFWYARTLLVKKSGGFSEVGSFDAAYQILTIIMMVTGSLSLISLPVFTRSKDVNTFKNVMKVNAIVSVLLVTLFCAIAPIIVRVYGAEFTGDSLLFCVVFLCAVPYSLCGVYRNYFIAESSYSIIIGIVLLQNLTVLMGLLLSEVVTAFSFSVINLSSWFLAASTYVLIYLRKVRRIYD